MATYGKGLSRYVGLNFAPVAVIDATAQLHAPQLLVGFAALKLGLTSAVRTVSVSYRNVDHPDSIALGQLAVGTTAR